MSEILGFDLSTIDYQAWLVSARDFLLPRLIQSALQLLLVAVVFLVARRLLRAIKRKVTDRTKTQLDDILMVMTTRMALYSIAFWGGWRLAHIWDLPGVARLVSAVWIVALALPVSRFLSDILKVFEERVVAQTETKLDDTALPWVNRGVQVLVVGTAVMIGLHNLGLDITPLLAGASVAGFAFSFAAKDTLANLIAGILLVVDRPFEVGDRIELWNAPAQQSSWGDVIEIGLRATKIRTPDNIVIIIPNSVITNRDIINWTASGDHVRVRIPIGIAYDADVETAKKLILEVARQAKGVNDAPAPVCILRGFGASSVDLELRIWLQDARQRRLVADWITEQVKATFDANGIEIPYPKRDLYIKSMPTGERELTGEKHV